MDISLCQTKYHYGQNQSNTENINSLTVNIISACFKVFNENTDYGFFM